MQNLINLSLQVSSESIRKAFNEIDGCDSVEPDGVPHYFLSKCWSVLESPIMRLFNKSLVHGYFPKF